MTTTNLTIDEMYAFIATDPDDGNEGIPAFQGPDGVLLPMVGADMEMIDRLRPIAQRLVDRSGTSIRIVKFSEKTEIEVLISESQSSS